MMMLFIGGTRDGLRYDVDPAARSCRLPEKRVAGEVRAVEIEVYRRRYLSGRTRGVFVMAHESIKGNDELLELLVAGYAGLSDLFKRGES